MLLTKNIQIILETKSEAYAARWVNGDPIAPYKILRPMYLDVLGSDFNENYGQGIPTSKKHLRVW